MRLRRRHAWGAVLIGLFALPVLAPEGVPALERPIGQTFGWFARAAPLNPRLWGEASADGDDEAGVRERALEQDQALLWERFVQEIARRDAEQLLAGALQQSELDRLPISVRARVLRANDPAPFRSGLVIDRGAEDGLVEGCAVVDGRVYLGSVRVLHARSAYVQLFTDPHSRLEVGLRTDTSQRVRGFLRGTGRGEGAMDLDVRFVRLGPDTGKVVPGAPVFTSNADERIPPNLLVGWVTDVRDPDMDGLPIVTMRPAYDLARALEVFVLIPQAAK